MIGRFLSPEQELRLFSVASTRPEWSMAFWVSVVTAARESAKLPFQALQNPCPPNGQKGYFRSSRK
jgi:hypothetical protein